MPSQDTQLLHRKGGHPYHSHRLADNMMMTHESWHAYQNEEPPSMSTEQGWELALAAMLQHAK